MMRGFMEVVEGFGMGILLVAIASLIIVALAWTAYGLAELFAWLDFSLLPPNPYKWGR
jgi:hypothetical protein